MTNYTLQSTYESTKPPLPPMTMRTWPRGGDRTLHVSVKHTLMFLFNFLLFPIRQCFDTSMNPMVRVLQEDMSLYKMPS